MSYLEEWNNIEGMIENHNVSKSTIIPPEKRQALALMHIAKCLSVIADDIVGDCKKCKEATDDKYCEDCLYYDKSIDQEPCFSCSKLCSCNWESKKATDKKPCSNCIHSNDEDELNCGVCDESHSEYKPFGFRGNDDEIEVKCPKCKKIITISKKLKLFYMHLKCPNCNTDFNYEIDTGICSY